MDVAAGLIIKKNQLFSFHPRNQTRVLQNFNNELELHDFGFNSEFIHQNKLDTIWFYSLYFKNFLPENVEFLKVIVALVVPSGSNSNFAFG